MYWQPQVHILEPSAWLSLVPWYVREWVAVEDRGSNAPVGHGRWSSAGNLTKMQNEGLACPPMHAQSTGPVILNRSGPGVGVR